MPTQAVPSGLSTPSLMTHCGGRAGVAGRGGRAPPRAARRCTEPGGQAGARQAAWAHVGRRQDVHRVDQLAATRADEAGLVPVRELEVGEPVVAADRVRAGGGVKVVWGTARHACTAPRPCAPRRGVRPIPAHGSPSAQRQLAQQRHPPPVRVVAVEDGGVGSGLQLPAAGWVRRRHATVASGDLAHRLTSS